MPNKPQFLSDIKNARFLFKVDERKYGSRLSLLLNRKFSMAENYQNHLFFGIPLYLKA